MNEFKNDITLFIKCDNLVKSFNEKATAMREQRDTYSNRIMSFMNENKLQDTKLELPRFNSTLRIAKHSQQETLSYNFLHKTFIKYFRDRNEADKLLLYIREQRRKEMKSILTRNEYKI